MKASINRNIEHEVLRGGNPRLARDHWSHPAEALPLLDEQSTRYPASRARKRKKGKAKERCNANPNGHTHEWMKDSETVPLMRWVNPWWNRKEIVIGEYEVVYRLCAHCGKIQWRDNGRWKPGSREHRWYGATFPNVARCYRKGGQVYLDHRYIY